MQLKSIVKDGFSLIEPQVSIISHFRTSIYLLQKDVIIIVAVILLPIAALIGLTISQVVKSSIIRDDALQAQKDIENFLRVQDLVIAFQVPLVDIWFATF